MARLGIGPETHVVAYDDGPGNVAARLWFMLRAHGHQGASLLDGGLAAWRAGGYPLSTVAAHARPAQPRKLALDRSRIVELEEMKRILLDRSTVLLDARARERYRGEIEPLDARAGHIPGAVNAPFHENVRSTEDPRFRPPDELRRLYQSLGVRGEVVVSCGSGVNACQTALALELAGLGPARLYVGSFSEWSRLPDEPVATGSEPGRLDAERAKADVGPRH